MRELHLHLDGSLRPERVKELAEYLNMEVGSLEEVSQKMKVPDQCKSLNEYLERFDLPLQFLQKADFIEAMTYDLVEDLAELGLEYGEIRFAPQLHTQEGLNQEEVVEASIKGVRRATKDYPRIGIGLILCAMRGEGNEEENLETLRITREFLGDVVCGFDLAGAEALFPTSKYQDLFAQARDLNVPFTIHAGEADGPESVWDALSFGAKRIGHGVRSIEDPDLVETLVEKKIALEVCITSNLQTKLVDRLEDHPIKKLFDAGVHVTLNSDNITVSNTDLIKERQIAKDILGFSDQDLKKMDEYAREASFLQ